MSTNTFPGGIHPPEEKELTEQLPFETMPAPSVIILPLSQHIGRASTPKVKKGDEILPGVTVAEAEGFVSAPVHSSVAGKVKSISREVNTGGFPEDAIVIIPNGQAEIQKFPALDPMAVSPEDIRNRVAEAGIVGQGGAAFPTSVKLTPPKDISIDAVILNGCECEPYLTRDYRFMVERPDAIISGLKLIMKALGVDKGTIGIEDNKPKAISILSDAVKQEPTLDVVTLKTKYPQGAEKMLIKAVNDREVPPGKLPLDVGIVIQNIGTAIAIHDAVVNGAALITAAVTVTGKGVREPKNLIIPVGTPISEVLEYCGGVTDDAAKVVVGGPMMGIAQYDLGAPVMKATSGIVVLTRDEIRKREETPCLRCGKCVDACPLHLIPTRLARLTQVDMLEDAEQLGITVCMECGTCAFTCPANIPLVQWLRLGKQAVMKMQRERQAQASNN